MATSSSRRESTPAQMAAGVDQDGCPRPSPEQALAVHADRPAPETPCSVLPSVPYSGLQLPMPLPLPLPPSETKVEAAVANVHGGPQQLLKQARHHSQPALMQLRMPMRMPRSESTREQCRDRRFDHFKTFSGRLERQLSAIRGLPVQHQPPTPTDVEHAAGSKISEEDTDTDIDGNDVPTADRFFAALEGPELDTLRATEVAVLPEDSPWPFLLRFPITAFGMCLGVSSQAMLWKTLHSEPSTAFLHVPQIINHLLWWASVTLTAAVSVVYLLKAVFYFEAVRREFHHPVRANFFFAPWIACLFLAKGVPTDEIDHAVWYTLMAPIFILDLKVYGQWMSSGENRLSKVANPTNHLAVVGNFVGALLGARMGLKEPPVFFFAVGLAHYLVLFVTLYQRLPTNVQLPKELHPVFFLFVAAPSVASMAWARITGEFSHGAKLAYFVSLFLYASLAVRANLFRGFRFSLAWWAYTFPVTSAAMATVLYSSAVDNVATRAMAVGLSGVAAATVAAVLATTVYHGFVRGDLFPNDVSIAITKRKPRFSKILTHIRTSGSDVKEIVLSISNSNPKHGVYSDDSGEQRR